MQRCWSPIRRVAVGTALVVAVSSCGSAGSSPGDTGPDEVPGDVLLRATITQALPPESLFPWVPAVTITADRTVVTAGPVPAIFPGPLLPNLRGRSISEAGFERLVSGARTLGLLEGNGDFSPSDVMPGSQRGLVEVVVDGALRTITGDPNLVMHCVTAPCDPVPGTPEAFGVFWQALLDLPTILGDDLGQEFAYEPGAFALLIGVEPMDGGGIAPQVVGWPLDTALADIGLPVGDRLLPRCGTVRGEDAAILAAAFSRATQLTRWVDRGGAEADAVAIAVRPLLPGEDVCRDLFGLEE